MEGGCCQSVQKYQYVLLVNLHRTVATKGGKEEKKKKRTCRCQVPVRVHFLVHNCLARIAKTTKKIGKKRKKREEVEWIDFKMKEMSDSKRGKILVEGS